MSQDLRWLHSLLRGFGPTHPLPVKRIERLTQTQARVYQGKVGAGRQETRVCCGSFSFLLHCFVGGFLGGRLEEHLGAVLGERGGGRGGVDKDHAVGPAAEGKSAVQEARFVGSLPSEQNGKVKTE